jgi:hypothetical protein
MANICENTIAVVGLKEPPEEFVKKLSKAMFDIDLDNMDVAKWGHYKCEGGKLYDIFHIVDEQTGEEKLVRQEVHVGNPDTSICEDGKYYSLVHEVDEATGNSVKRLEEVDPKTWYGKILAQKYPPLAVLVPHTPFTRCGVTVPRFYVEKKWRPVYEEVKKASEAFPDLLFHVDYWIEQDGPTGEFVLRAGKLLEEIERGASWYLFDELRYPSLSLLPGYMGLTLAQHGASRVQDAIETIERLRGILDDPRFIDSPFHEFRNGPKLSVTKTTLDELLAHMRQEAKELSFEGVFLEEAEAAAEAAARELGEDPAA